MKLEYQLTEDDLFNFNDFHQKHSPVAIKARRKSSISCGVAMFVVLAVLTTKDYGFDIILISIFVIPAILVGFLCSLYVKSHSKRFIRKAIREGKNISLNTPVTVELTIDEILSDSSLGESKMKWDVVERIEETDDYVYIYISSLSAIIVPKKKVKTDIPIPELFGEIQKLKKLAEPEH